MKKLVIISALVALIAGCGAAPGPKATVEKAFSALKSGDGKALIECMSAEQVEELNASVEEMKANPEESAQMMAFLGVETTADEITSLDAAGFVSLLMKSEMFSSEFADMEMTFGAERIEGEEAWVEVTVDGETDEIKLVKENGRWVIAEGFDMM
jgi:hypothetical protein